MQTGNRPHGSDTAPDHVADETDQHSPAADQRRNRHFANDAFRRWSHQPAKTFEKSCSDLHFRTVHNGENLQQKGTDDTSWSDGPPGEKLFEIPNADVFEFSPHRFARMQL